MVLSLRRIYGLPGPAYNQIRIRFSSRSGLTQSKKMLIQALILGATFFNGEHSDEVNTL